ncbi:DUF3592 domain-containing protein [Micromonospora sp. NPDC006766]|uniref:DUF3592 domain-containing protein n=1 Tax=Micromonospora sp. NPDC006766 TaxID=3154778 RepID=UPI0033DCC639
MPVPLLVLLVMSGLGSAGIGYGTVRFWRDRRLLREGRRVPGEVVDLLVSKIRSGEIYTPVVRYHTTDGMLMTSSPGRWRQSPFTPDGNPVTVVYDPSRPSRILVVPDGGSGTESVVIPFVALLLVGAGVVIGGVYTFHTF